MAGQERAPLAQPSPRRRYPPQRAKRASNARALAMLAARPAISEEPVMADAVSACSSNNPSERRRTSEHLIFVSIILILQYEFLTYKGFRVNLSTPDKS